MVYPDKMKANMDQTHGLVFSQRLLLMLIDKGISRELAYDTVQPLAMEAWENHKPFRPLVEADSTIKEHLTPEEIESAFDLVHHTRRVNEIFERVGI